MISSLYSTPVSCCGHNILLLGTNTKNRSDIHSWNWKCTLISICVLEGSLTRGMQRNGRVISFVVRYLLGWNSGNRHNNREHKHEYTSKSFTMHTVQDVQTVCNTNGFDDHYQLPYCPCHMRSESPIITPSPQDVYEAQTNQVTSVVWGLTSWVQILRPGGWSWCSSLTQTCWAWHTGGRCSHQWQRSYGPCYQTYTHWKSSLIHTVRCHYTVVVPLSQLLF